MSKKALQALDMVHAREYPNMDPKRFAKDRLSNNINQPDFRTWVEALLNTYYPDIDQNLRNIANDTKSLADVTFVEKTVLDLLNAYLKKQRAEKIQASTTDRDDVFASIPRAVTKPAPQPTPVPQPTPKPEKKHKNILFTILGGIWSGFWKLPGKIKIGIVVALVIIYAMNRGGTGTKSPAPTDTPPTPDPVFATMTIIAAGNELSTPIPTMGPVTITIESLNAQLAGTIAAINNCSGDGFASARTDFRPPSIEYNNEETFQVPNGVQVAIQEVRLSNEYHFKDSGGVPIPGCGSNTRVMVQINEADNEAIIKAANNGNSDLNGDGQIGIVTIVVHGSTVTATSNIIVK